MTYFFQKIPDLAARKYLIFVSVLIFLILTASIFAITRSGYLANFNGQNANKGELQILSPKDETITDTLGVLATYKLGKGQKDVVAYLRVNNGTFRLIKYKKVSDSEFLFRTSLNLQKLNPGTYSLSIFVVDITGNKPGLASTKTANFEIKR